MNPWVSLITLAALYGVLFYLWYAVKTRRGIGAWLSRTCGARNPQREIQLIESLGVGPRASLLLIEVRGQPLLVAQFPQGIQVFPLERADPERRAASGSPDSFPPKGAGSALGDARTPFKVEMARAIS